MITLQKEPFLQAIKAIKSSCGKANLQPILNTIHLETFGDGALTLTATDINNSARAVVEANITKSINVCVNAEKLDAIISRLNDTITLNVEDAYLVIKSGNAKFDLLWLNSKEYPNPDFKLTDNPIVIGANSFINGINKTIFATQTVEGQILNGVCLTLSGQNGFEFASTDGNRLCQAKFDIPINVEGQYVLPKKVLTDLLKVAKDEIKLHINNNRIVFETNNCVFVTALLSGIFPKYQQLIPTNNPKKVKINKNDLLNALETVAIMVNDRTNICNFKFIDDSLELTANCDNGKSKDYVTIDSNINGEFNMAFNYRYLIEGLKAIENDAIIFEIKDSISACLIKDGNNYLYIIMPCQTNN